MTIVSANIVYVIAPSGAGKTFTGDYLNVVHGFKHIDGDGPLKSTHLPQYKEMGMNFWTVCTKYMSEKNEDGPKEMWAPYFEELARQTLEAAKDHDKVVLSHATYRQPFRDLFVEKLVEGGIKMEQISIIQLTIDPEVKHRGLYYRHNHLADAAGITMTDFVKQWMDFEGEMTEKKFVEASMKGEQDGPPDMFQNCEMENSKKVDVSGRNITHCDGVDAALGLTRTVDWSYEEIRDKVKPIDEQRDKEMVANGGFDSFNEEEEKRNANLTPKEGEDPIKVEEIRKRRSSIIQAELINDFRRSSVKSHDEFNRRRSSLIMTGKIVIEE